MSLLAWLMLVLNAAHAVPMAAMARAGHAAATSSMSMPAATTTGTACDHAGVGHGQAPEHFAHSDHCCSAGTSSASCHCPTLCAPALLPVPDLVFATLAPAGSPTRGAIGAAPQRPGRPPLRPPLH
jgi:hypothetical protein